MLVKSVSTLNASSYHAVRYTIISILQRKLRPREGKLFAQGHTARKCCCLGLDAGILVPGRRGGVNPNSGGVGRKHCPFSSVPKCGRG